MHSKSIVCKTPQNCYSGLLHVCEKVYHVCDNNKFSNVFSLLQLIQISINMNYLEKSCTYLEDFISNITG